MTRSSLSHLLITASILALAGCASAPPAGPGAAAPAAAKPARTAAEIKMDEILDNPKATAVLTKHAPALAANPQLSMARGMSLADVAGYAESGLTPALVSAIVADMNKL